MAIFDFFLSRNNAASTPENYIGHIGRLFYNSENGVLRLSDGVTPGGKPTAISATTVARSSGVVAINSKTPTVITDMTLTPPAGRYIVMYNSGYLTTLITSTTQQAAADVATLYAALMALSSTVTRGLPTYTNETLGPGVYDYNGATTIEGTLTLDAGNNPNAQFIFRCVGAFSTASASEVVLINGATSNNVWFVSQGAPSTGVDSVMRGSMLAATGHNASSGAGAVIEGRMLTVSGNISLGTITTLTEPTGATSLPLNSLSLFNVFAAVGDLANTGAGTIALSIGTNSGTITGFQNATVEGDIFPPGDQVIGNVHYGIYVDGVLVPDSARQATRISLVSKYLMILQTAVIITAGQTIDVRAYADIGAFNVGPNMSLILIPIAT